MSLLAILCLGLWQVSAQLPFEIPPHPFTLTCPWEAALGGDGHGTTLGRNATAVPSPRTLACCLTNDAASRCPQEQSLTLTVTCWMAEGLSLFLCNLKPSGEVGNVTYTLELRDASHRSHLPEPWVRASDCQQREVVQCLVHSVLPDHTYWVWLTARIPPAHLTSPLMAVTPGNIVKPSAPLDLRWEVTADSFHRVGWAVPKHPPFPLRYQLRYSPLAPEAAWQVLDVGEESVTLSELQVEVSYTVQARCVRRTALGVWSDWSEAVRVDVQEITYEPWRVVTVAGSAVTVRCVFHNKAPGAGRLVWLLNMVEKVPADLYTLVSEHESSVTLRDLPVTSPSDHGHVLQCCPNTTHCNYRYAEIIVIDPTIWCETDGAMQRMTCRWQPMSPNVVTESEHRLRYYRKGFDCTELGGSEETRGEVEECGVWGNETQQCHVQPVHLLSAHVMWLEIYLPDQTLRTSPTCHIPMDVVKPWPPADVQAELTVPEGDLRVSWRAPRLPPYPLSCQLRYSANTEPPHWMSLVEVGVGVEAVVVTLADRCEVYVAEVRCRPSEGPGHWSEWSEHAHTERRDLQAPTTGPDFWRLLTPDPVSGHTHVTLVWKRLTREVALCSVRGFCLRSLSPGREGDDPRPERVGDGDATTYSFPLTPDVRTVSLIAFNSVGPSTNNYNLTLWPDGGEVRVLRSLYAWQVNSSCVVVTWSLAEGKERPWEYVVEWDRVPRGVGAHMKWLRTSANLNQAHLHDYFSPLVQYRVTIHPLLLAAPGQPMSTYINGESEPQGVNGLHVTLPLAFLSVLVLVGTLLISKRRVKKLVWQEIPNPSKCSWARGVDFNKPGTFGNLLGKDPKGVPVGGCLFAEPEVFAVAVVEEEVARYAGGETPDSGADSVMEFLPDSPPGSQPGTPPASGALYAQLVLASSAGLELWPGSQADEGMYSGTDTDGSGSDVPASWEKQEQRSSRESGRRPCEPGSQGKAGREGEFRYLGQTTPDRTLSLNKYLTVAFEDSTEGSGSSLDSSSDSSLHSAYSPQTLRPYLPQFHRQAEPVQPEP